MRVPITYLAESGVTFVLGHPQLIRHATLAGRARGQPDHGKRGAGDPETCLGTPTFRRRRHGHRDRARGSGGNLRGVPPGRPGRRPQAGRHRAGPDARQEVRGAARGADLGPEPGGHRLDVHIHDPGAFSRMSVTVIGTLATRDSRAGVRGCVDDAILLGTGLTRRGGGSRRCAARRQRAVRGGGSAGGRSRRQRQPVDGGTPAPTTSVARRGHQGDGALHAASTPRNSL